MTNCYRVRVQGWIEYVVAAEEMDQAAEAASRAALHPLTTHAAVYADSDRVIEVTEAWRTTQNPPSDLRAEQYIEPGSDRRRWVEYDSFVDEPDEQEAAEK